jgi:hypothetical protein
LSLLEKPDPSFTFQTFVLYWRQTAVIRREVASKPPLLQFQPAPSVKHHPEPSHDSHSDSIISIVPVTLQPSNGQSFQKFSEHFSPELDDTNVPNAAYFKVRKPLFFSSESLQPDPTAHTLLAMFGRTCSLLISYAFLLQEYSSFTGSEEEIVMQWLQDVTGLLISQGRSDAFFQMLRSGVVLCQAANKILPHSIPKISMQDKPFNQRENISAFINFLRRVGVAEKDLFGTEDLFEGKNTRQVVISLLALGRALYKVPNYSGPSPSRPETLRRRSTYEVRQDGLWGKAGGQFGQVRPRS